MDPSLKVAWDPTIGRAHREGTRVWKGKRGARRRGIVGLPSPKCTVRFGHLLGLGSYCRDEAAPSLSRAPGHSGHAWALGGCRSR